MVIVFTRLVPDATKPKFTSPVFGVRLAGGGVSELSIFMSSKVHLAPSSSVELYTKAM